MSELSADPVNFFPGNVLVVLDDEFSKIPELEQVVRRPLNYLDPTYSMGLVALNWTPGGIEIAGQGQFLGEQEPTLQEYEFLVQALIKHMDAEEGLALHSVFSKIVRTMLARNPLIAVRLRSLTETTFGMTERFQRKDVGRQRYAANEIEGEWLYLSTTELKITTEVVPA